MSHEVKKTLAFQPTKCNKKVNTVEIQSDQWCRVSTTVFTTREPETNKLPDGRLDKNHTYTPPKAKANILFLHRFSYCGEKLRNIMDRLLGSQQQTALSRQSIIIKDY